MKIIMTKNNLKSLGLYYIIPTIVIEKRDFNEFIIMLKFYSFVLIFNFVKNV